MRKLTDRQLERLESWADEITKKLQHSDADVVDRGTLELLVRMVRAEVITRDEAGADADDDQ